MINNNEKPILYGWAFLKYKKMIKIIKECFSRELNKKLNINDKVTLSNEDEVVLSGFAEKVTEKKTKIGKQSIKKK